MKALTLIQPWASCITHGDKRVENRTWAPPASLLGQRFAIHAGKAFDDDAHVELLARNMLPARPWPGGSVLGTARLVGIQRDLGPLVAAEGVDARRVLALASEGAAWFVGPIGWLLDDVIALPRPIPARGAQGLWTLPPDVAAQVAEQEAEVRRAA